MSQPAFAKRVTLARRYPRRQVKKESFFFRAANPDPHIVFIRENRIDARHRGGPSVSGRHEEG
jgi:hypothetical protein